MENHKFQDGEKMTMRYVKVKVAKIVYSEEIISFNLDPDHEYYHLNKILESSEINDVTFDDLMEDINSTIFFKSYDNHVDYNAGFFDFQPERVIYDASLLSQKDFEKLSPDEKKSFLLNQPINKEY
jgi:hypothetical protein